jgi:hypothetical protein
MADIDQASEELFGRMAAKYRQLQTFRCEIDNTFVHHSIAFFDGEDKPGTPVTRPPETSSYTIAYMRPNFALITGQTPEGKALAGCDGSIQYIIRPKESNIAWINEAKPDAGAIRESLSVTMIAFPNLLLGAKPDPEAYGVIRMALE